LGVGLNVGHQPIHFTGGVPKQDGLVDVLHRMSVF